MTDGQDTIKQEINNTPKDSAPVQVETPKKEQVAAKSSAGPVVQSNAARTVGGKDFNPIDQKKDLRKNRRVSRRAPRQKSEFDQKIIDIRRVTRVSSGGRRFSFSVAIVIGNKKGKIGVGTGKAGDTSLAIDKAVKDAQKNAIIVKTTKSMSIPHEVVAKFSSARIVIMPAPKRGVIAGSSMRDIIELGGLNDLNGKILSGSKNKLNIARATIKALSLLEKTATIGGESAKSKSGLDETAAKDK
ncbi:MAG TPA: 30S ribosomal protein S5 [Candidatus Paceibacterota bacterium]|nr:30S ribosomal protein S5 [Candidatus Paceibacterota bacterium]HRZ34305.1 30S ribosomal protein S5 [Candidatus Paceibacterota bacterium]